MTQTQINGGTQIQPNTVGSGQVGSSVIVAGGGNPFSGNQSMGSNKLTSLATPTLSTDAATKGYVDTAIQGASLDYRADAGTNTETLTIAAGSVTTINGTTVNGVSVDVNDFVFIGNAPASTGAAGGSALSTQPANGLYQVTAVSTNISVSRASEFSAVNPAGQSVFVAGGALWGGYAFVVTSPNVAGSTYTLGTTNVAFTQVGGLSQVTSDGTLVISGSEITRAALTGDVTAAAGSNATAIAAHAVTLAKLATAVYNTTPTASTLSEWDANVNLSANGFIPGFTTAATGGGTTTLTIASTQVQVLTGSSTQTVKLPTTGVVAGALYIVINESSGNVTVQSSGANTILTLTGAASAPFSAAMFIANVATPTTAANWVYLQFATGTASGTVTSVSVATANGFQGTVATATSTPAITIETNFTGVGYSSGTAFAAATGANIVAPSSGHGKATRETPSGTINGSNQTFTLVNTPVSGTEELHQNGLLLRAGASYDYTISGATITMNTAPASSPVADFLCCSYWY
jgi:hypothetical protein